MLYGSFKGFKRALKVFEKVATVTIPGPLTRPRGPARLRLAGQKDR
jgi:hypothetical protein